jgi:hypothetical protein
MALFELRLGFADLCKPQTCACTYISLTAQKAKEPQKLKSLAVLWWSIGDSNS